MATSLGGWTFWRNMTFRSSITLRSTRLRQIFYPASTLASLFKNGTTRVRRLVRLSPSVKREVDGEAQIWNCGRNSRRIPASSCLRLTPKIELHRAVQSRRVQRYGSGACSFQCSSDFQIQNTQNVDTTKSTTLLQNLRFPLYLSAATLPCCNNLVTAMFPHLGHQHKNCCGTLYTTELIIPRHVCIPPSTFSNELEFSFRSEN